MSCAQCTSEMTTPTSTVARTASYFLGQHYHPLLKKKTLPKLFKSCWRTTSMLIWLMSTSAPLIDLDLWGIIHLASETFMLSWSGGTQRDSLFLHVKVRETGSSMPMRAWHHCARRCSTPFGKWKKTSHLLWKALQLLTARSSHTRLPSMETPGISATWSPTGMHSRNFVACMWRNHWIIFIYMSKSCEPNSAMIYCRLLFMKIFKIVHFCSFCNHAFILLILHFSCTPWFIRWDWPWCELFIWIF